MSALTIEATFYVENITGGGWDWNAIIMKGEGANDGYGFMFEDNVIEADSGKFSFYLPTTDNSVYNAPYYSSLNLNNQYQISGK